MVPTRRCLGEPKSAAPAPPAKYFTPNGRSIHGKGIEPDVVVEYQYDENNPEADNQLQAAIDCLK